MSNLPIYRAKTIKQDYNEWEECEQLKKIDGIWYAIGFYDCKREIKTYLGDWEITHLILIRKSTAISEISTAEIIDILTLSIHFPDMIDSQGNKVFASLQDDGKGGDILEDLAKYWEGECVVAKYLFGEFVLNNGSEFKAGAHIELCAKCKDDWIVIGIQK